MKYFEQVNINWQSLTNIISIFIVETIIWFNIIIIIIIITIIIIINVIIIIK